MGLTLDNKAALDRVCQYFDKEYLQNDTKSNLDFFLSDVIDPNTVSTKYFEYCNTNMIPIESDSSFLRKAKNYIATPFTYAYNLWTHKPETEHTMVKIEESSLMKVSTIVQDIALDGLSAAMKGAIVDSLSPVFQRYIESTFTIIGEHYDRAEH